MTRRRDEVLPPLQVLVEDSRAAAYPESGQRCLVCSGPARPFSVETVPELLSYMKRLITSGQFRDAVTRRGDGCWTAPLSGTSVCATTGKVNL